MKYVLLFFLLLPQIIFAGEGHRWAKLNYESKAMIIAMYEIGISDGCVYGVGISTSELFSDEHMQGSQALKLVTKCPSTIVTTAHIMSKVVGIVDNAYSRAGTAKIPIGITVKLSLNSYSSGKTAIDDAELNKWISASSQL
jgi:hypothetical protein